MKLSQQWPCPWVDHLFLSHLWPLVAWAGQGSRSYSLLLPLTNLQPGLPVLTAACQVPATVSSKSETSAFAKLLTLGRPSRRKARRYHHGVSQTTVVTLALGGITVCGLWSAW